jgi:hypothetical protein
MGGGWGAEIPVRQQPGAILAATLPSTPALEHLLWSWAAGCAGTRGGPCAPMPPSHQPSLTVQVPPPMSLTGPCPGGLWYATTKPLWTATALRSQWVLLDRLVKLCCPDTRRGRRE